MCSELLSWEQFWLPHLNLSTLLSKLYLQFQLGLSFSIFLSHRSQASATTSGPAGRAWAAEDQPPLPTAQVSTGEVTF